MALTGRSLTRWFLVALAALLVAAQFVPVRRTNPPSDPQRDITAHVAVPPVVASALDRSCRDCHAHRTRWPWYSRVAPVSWMVVDDVNSGRRHLNLSEWAEYDGNKAAEKLKDVCDEITSGEMPDFKYTLLHRDARLSDSEVQAICGWANAERTKLLAR